MSNPRIPYRLASEAPALPSFRDKRILVHFAINMEHWRFDHPIPRGIITPPQGRHSVPDVPNFAWAEYGMRVGMQRLFDLFSAREIPVGAILNANVIDIYPQCAERSLKLGWEFIGHGLYQQALPSEPDEESVIAASLERIARFTGKPVRGWLGPGLAESAATPDHLRSRGVDYLLDWVLDDQPCWMTTAHGPLLSVPYSLELNDSPIYAIEKHATGEYANRVRRTLAAFDLAPQGGPWVMTISLHPHLMGVPHRFVELIEIVEMVQAHPQTVCVTPAEIADWFIAACPSGKASVGLTAAG